MRAFLVLALMTALPGTLAAQTTPDAFFYANARFSKNTSVMLKRTLSRSFAPTLVDQFDQVLAAALGEGGDRQELVLILGQFDPLWDPTGNIIPAAATRYAGRLAAVPRSAVLTWASLIGVDRRRAALSLTGMESLWVAGNFNNAAFAALVTRLRAS